MNQPIPGATLASVLHLRLADFGSKAVVEQARLRAQLEAVVAACVSALPVRDRIILDAPDGLALAVLGNPNGAFKFAQRCLEAAPVLPLCVGMHHGAIALGGGEDARGLLGDGLRSASVAARFAKPAQIIVTRAFREALSAHVASRESELRRAGTFADDSVRTYELFIVDRNARRQRRKWLLATGLMCIAIGVAAGVGVRLYESGALKFPVAAAPPVTAQAPVPAQAPAPAPAAVAPKPAAPKPAPLKRAVLVFEVTPAGRVSIDGKVRGDIPALKRLELAPGRYLLEIHYRKEDPFKRLLELRPGQQLVIKHKFFEAPKSLKDLFK